MPLTISLPADDEALLKRRAEASGQPIEQFVERLISRELHAPLTLAEAAEPFQRAIEAANVSEQDFTAAIIEARDAARRDRKHRSA